VIRVYDDAGNLIKTHKHKGDFKECLMMFAAGANAKKYFTP
jgi:hypothetical protein